MCGTCVGTIRYVLFIHFSGRWRFFGYQFKEITKVHGKVKELVLKFEDMKKGCSKKVFFITRLSRIFAHCEMVMKGTV